MASPTKTEIQLLLEKAKDDVVKARTCLRRRGGESDAQDFIEAAEALLGKASNWLQRNRLASAVADGADS